MPTVEPRLAPRLADARLENPLFFWVLGCGGTGFCATPSKPPRKGKKSRTPCPNPCLDKQNCCSRPRQSRRSPNRLSSVEQAEMNHTDPRNGYYVFVRECERNSGRELG